MIIEKKETINTIEFKKKEAPVVSVQTGEMTDETQD